MFSQKFKKKMEEYVHMTWMHPLPAKVNRFFFYQIKAHNSKTEKVVKSAIELALPFMVAELVCKFQIIS